MSFLTYSVSPADIITGERLRAAAISRGFLYSHTHDIENNIIRAIYDREFGGGSAAAAAAFTILTHNSDDTIDSKYIPLLDSPAVGIWYAQNADIRHPKLRAVPIGLANSEWGHGNLDVFCGAAGGQRDRLCFFGFNVATNRAVREPIRAAVKRANPHWEFLENLSFQEYCAKLARSKYCICPRGNGLDTHRLWECLYYGVIPLVDRTTVTENFEYLGLVIVDDWAKITEDYLCANYEEFSGRLKRPPRMDEIF
jgi:hypothetical protein